MEREIKGWETPALDMDRSEAWIKGSGCEHQGAVVFSNSVFVPDGSKQEKSYEYACKTLFQENVGFSYKPFLISYTLCFLGQTPIWCGRN